MIGVDRYTNREICSVSNKIENENVKYVHADEGEGVDADIDID